MSTRFPFFVSPAFVRRYVKFFITSYPQQNQISFFIPFSFLFSVFSVFSLPVARLRRENRRRRCRCRHCCSFSALFRPHFDHDRKDCKGKLNFFFFIKVAGWLSPSFTLQREVTKCHEKVNFSWSVFVKQTVGLTKSLIKLIVTIFLLQLFKILNPIKEIFFYWPFTF